MGTWDLRKDQWEWKVERAWSPWVAPVPYPVSAYMTWCMDAHHMYYVLLKKFNENIMKIEYEDEDELMACVKWG